MYPGRGYAVNGGLMSYDTDPLALFYQVGADYVGPLLDGTREQAELFHAQAPDWQLAEEAHQIGRASCRERV